jgi:transcriptional regulator with XRE-family HTH domain
MAKVPNPIDIHVGNRVRIRRMMLSMSQEKVGNALGISFQQVQKYEKGTNRLGASRLQHLAQILQVPIAYFFEGAPQARARSTQTRQPADESGAFVTELLSKPHGLAMVMAFAKIKSRKVQDSIVQLAENIVTMQME